MLAERLGSDNWKEAHATQNAPLGAIKRVPANWSNNESEPSGSQDPLANSGESEWIYVKNDSGADIIGGLVIRRHTTTLNLASSRLGAVTTTRYNALGVTQWTIPNGYFSWILRRGRGQVQSNGSVTVDTAIVPAANGQVTDFTANNEHRCIGYALEDDGGVASTSYATSYQAHIDCTSAA